MAEVLPTLSRGIEVPLGKIDHELKRLWSAEGGGATRASLINLAVYCEGTTAMAENTELIARLTQDHACRALLIVAEPDAPEQTVRAWISAHCHVSRAGAKQVCCEQITFLLEGCLSSLIPNIVFSHLDSDLPLYFWLRDALPAAVDRQLWTWVDRLIVDSASWTDPAAQMRQLLASIASARSRLVLRDLNWTRTMHLRQAAAMLFDDPVHQRELQRLDRIALCYAPGGRTAALLFAGWLSVQLGWPCAKNAAGEVTLSRPGGVVRVETRESADRTGVGFEFVSPNATYTVSHPAGSDFLEAEIRFEDHAPFKALFPAGEDAPGALLSEELVRRGKDTIFRRVLAAALPVME
jgi:glucose-6-phosphate dehydrogenase assembly protein OpcA